MKARKILIITKKYHPSVGGGETAAAEIGCALTSLGHEVHVATQALTDRVALLHDRIQILEFQHFDNTEPKGASEFLRLQELISKSGYHAAIILNAPSAWTRRICTIGRPRPKIIFLPIINLETVQHHLLTRNLPDLMADMAQADMIGTITESSCEAQLFRLAGIRHFFAPHPVRPLSPASDFRKAMNIPPDTTLFIMVANFWPVKNHIGLIQVMKRTRGDWRLALIGNPVAGNEQHYRSVIQEIDDPRIAVINNAPRPIVESAIAQADLVLLPSHAEGCPMVILEAMSCGTPWLATPTCGSVTDQAGGIVIPLELFPHAAQALVENRSEYNALSHLAKKHWKLCFSAERAQELFQAIIENSESIPDLRMPMTIRSNNSIIVERVIKKIKIA